MNDLIKIVTPLTRGIIWLAKDPGTSNPHYAQIDYILDGLLTANLKSASEKSNKVIVGQNFNQAIYVMILDDINSKEIQSYLSLFKNLGPENDIIVIDELGALAKLRPELKSVSSNLKVLQ